MAEKRNYINKKMTNIPIHANEYGKLPPQAPELEESVLGAIMVEKDSIELIDLEPRDFYKVVHQKIFQAILNLKNRQNPIDMHTVTEELRRTGDIDEIGGPYYITLLTAKVSSAAHLVYHSIIIKQKSISRQVIEMSSTSQTMAFDDKVDIDEVLEYVEKSLTEINNGNCASDSSNMEESLNETLAYISELQRKANLGISTAIPTELKQANKGLYGGWQAPDLIVLGARPGMGKTQLATSFAKTAGSTDNDCLFVSIEMTKIQLLLRMLTEDDGIDFDRLKTGKLTAEEWSFLESRIPELINLKINIADDSKIKYLNNIKSLARKLHRQGKLKMMIIDYLQLIRTKLQFQNRDIEIGYITGELKSLAKELNIPIILLSQLNRPKQGEKVTTPKLTDLRESGNIEQDADIVAFVHRPSYYDPNIEDSRGVPWKNRGKLIFAKYRDGAPFEIIFQHNERFKKIWDYDQYGNSDRPF